MMKWIALAGIALQLLVKIDGKKEIRVQCTVDTLSSYGIVGAELGEGLLVDFQIRGSNKSIYKVLIVPLQNYSIRPADRNDVSIFPVLTLMTVTDYAVVYIVNGQQPDDSLEAKLARDMMYLTEDFFKIGLNAQSVDDSKIEAPEGMNLIHLIEYRNYVEIDVAIPGSENLQPSPAQNNPDGKIARLMMSDERGKMSEIWVCAPPMAWPACIAELEKEMLGLVSEAQQQCLINFEESNRVHVFQEYKETLDRRIDYYPECYDKKLITFYNSKLEDFLIINPGMLMFDPDILFPDYEPKDTPDLAIDFHPGVNDHIMKLPADDVENLGKLLQIFKDYRKLAKKDKGEWVEGNMILGGPDREYRPSLSELMLSETGQRIWSIVEYTQAEILKDHIASQKIREKKITFVWYTFYHADVMGSGRFFYVDQMQETTVILKK